MFFKSSVCVCLLVVLMASMGSTSHSSSKRRKCAKIKPVCKGETHISSVELKAHVVCEDGYSPIPSDPHEISCNRRQNRRSYGSHLHIPCCGKPCGSDGNGFCVDCEKCGNQTRWAQCPKSDNECQQQSKCCCYENNESTPPCECDDSCTVNGNWGEWGTFGVCQPSCGERIKTRTRACDNPPPSNGGAACTGTSVDTMECPRTTCEFLGP